MTAALVPGAAVFVPPAHACSLLQPESPIQFIADSEVIVVGRVDSTGEEFVLRPEAYLKGPATGERLRFGKGATDCPTADVTPGERVLVYVWPGQTSWPLITQVYELRDGRAFREGERTRTELEVVGDIREVTGQYVVLANDETEGAGIDWGNVVIPLGLVLVVIFGIGLVLMRVWHRIDPS